MLMAIHSASAFVFFYSLFLSSLTLAKYQEGDRVTLWANMVGPYNNPQETYSFYSLPYCRPSGNATKNQGGRAVVLGLSQLIDTQIDIKFKRDLHKTSICEFKLDATMAKKFTDAIHNAYYFELFVDDLPLWGFVGDFYDYQKNHYLDYVVYTHWNLGIKYNGDQIHWFSIFNSLVTVILLAGLVSKILMRTLSNEDGKCTHEDNDPGLLEKEIIEEYGWKLLHGDVFRSPQNLVLLAAVVGTGVQLLMLVFLLVILAIFGRLYIRRGAITMAFLYCHALTSFISGCTSGAMYFQYGGEKWKKVMILTAFLFPFMCFAIGSILNTIAFFYGSLAAITFDTMVVAFILWAFVSVPLVVVGTFIGRNFSGMPNDPCRTNTIPRPIPEKKFYLKPFVISLLGGVLPFGSIFVEIYFVFTCLWNYKIYYPYGVMLLVFIILIVVTMCATILGTYVLLNAENYHWQWTSFFAGASITIYINLYSVYYYHVRTRMSGFLQGSFYFGSTLMFSLGLGILCGKFAASSLARSSLPQKS